MVINRNVGWPNLNLDGALTKSGGTSVHIVRLSKREIVGSLTYLPFFLSRIRLTISVPVFFISDAVHCILHANTCNLSRKYLRPSLQVLATAPASTCGKRRHYIGISSPMFFYWAELFPYYKSEGYLWDTPHFIMYDYHSLSQMLWSLFSFVSAFPGSCGSLL